MRVVITEDMLMFRELLVRSCREAGHEVVGETDSGAGAISLCNETRPDALLLDVRLPDIDGLEVVKIIHAQIPSVGIIVVTAYSSDFFFHRLDQSAVSGYIDKNAQTSRAVGESLAAVARGQRWLSPEYHRAKLRRLSDPHFFGKILTGREQTILSLIGHSFSNEQIGDRLQISTRTVEGHRSNLMLKLDLHSAAQLIVFAVEKGFSYGSMSS